MTVTPEGAGVFRVTSADDKDHYTVDVTAFDGKPVCTCRDWQCRCSPKLKTEKVILYGSIHRNTCKHIHAVIMYLGKQVAARMAGKKPEDVYDLSTGRSQGEAAE